MKKIILTTALISLGIGFQSIQAQVIKQKGIKIEEIRTKINEIAQKNDAASKEQLLIEAKALAEAKNENYNSLAANIYSYLNKNEDAEKITNSLLKKYPKGLKARQEAFSKIFSNKDLSAAVAEKQFTAFQKAFPEKSFEESDRNIYASGIGQLANLYTKENNLNKALELLNQVKSSPTYVGSAYSVASNLINQKEFKTALPLLTDLYTQGLDKKSPAARYSSGIASLYAKALLEENQSDKAIEILETQGTKSGNKNITMTLADAYVKQQRDLDGFILLEGLLKEDPKNAEVIAKITPLYNKLNQDKGSIDKYFAGITVAAKEASVAKYKSEMIKKEAPNFSLVNMKGQTVSLTDLKGKVVVLDFWATWCGPCKISFPGMQAAVNKYKDDKEVEFLFIDTWQREENYKEVVEKFIADNKYTFNVLFDEMKDRDKATTTSYGVKGIPHKVVIDKEGFIRFESSGGSDNIEKIVTEMETKIELARKS